MHTVSVQPAGMFLLAVIVKGSVPEIDSSPGVYNAVQPPAVNN